MAFKPRSPRVQLACMSRAASWPAYGGHACEHCIDELHLPQAGQLSPPDAGQRAVQIGAVYEQLAEVLHPDSQAPHIRQGTCGQHVASC